MGSRRLLAFPTGGGGGYDWATLGKYGVAGLTKAAEYVANHPAIGEAAMHLYDTGTFSGKAPQNAVVPPQYVGNTYDPNVMVARGGVKTRYEEPADRPNTLNAYLHGRDPGLIRLGMSSIPPLPHPINGGLTSDDVCLKCFDAAYVSNCTVPLIDNVHGNATAGNWWPIDGMCGPVFGIRQGASFDQRLGNSIWVQNMSFKFAFITAAIGNNVRYIIAYDKNSNGAWPVIGNFLAVNDLGSYGTFHAYQSYLYKSRIVILRDRTICVSGMSGGTVCPVLCEENIQCNLPVQFSGDTGTVGDIASGNILLICFRNDPATGVTGVVQVTDISIRFRYRDCAY